MVMENKERRLMTVVAPYPSLLPIHLLRLYIRPSYLPRSIASSYDRRATFRLLSIGVSYVESPREIHFRLIPASRVSDHIYAADGDGDGDGDGYEGGGGRPSTTKTSATTESDAG